MPISIDQWHVAVGLFGACRYAAIIKKMIWKYSNLKALTILLFFYSTIIFLLLVQHGDIEINPGPQKSNQSIFHVFIGMSTVYCLITKYPCWQLIIPPVNKILYVYQRHSLIPQYR